MSLYLRIRYPVKLNIAKIADFDVCIFISSQLFGSSYSLISLKKNAFVYFNIILNCSLNICRRSSELHQLDAKPISRRLSRAGGLCSVRTPETRPMGQR